MDDRVYAVKSMVQSVSWVSTPCWAVYENNIWLLTWDGRFFSVISLSA